jgi:transcriptional antiterminator Rof (Rho-off)
MVRPLDLKTDKHEEFLICRNDAGEMLTIRLDRIRSMKPV